MIKNNHDKYIYCFKGQSLLVKKSNNNVIIPLISEVYTDFKEELLFELPDKFADKNCCAYLLKEDMDLTPDFEFINLRYLYDKICEQAFFIAGKSLSLLNWSNNNQFCGKCGKSMADKKAEMAKHCPQCKIDIYPKISPAIIVAVTKEDEILLAHSNNFGANFYSVLAGFVDVGENLEDAVRREVKEEVNIEIQNIKYFGSQPWPFSDSLMLGFTAEYAGGNIKVDDVEIDKAGWFKAEELPQIPGKISIARKLIDWFTDQYK